MRNEHLPDIKIRYACTIKQLKEACEVAVKAQKYLTLDIAGRRKGELFNLGPKNGPRRDYFAYLTKAPFEVYCDTEIIVEVQQATQPIEPDGCEPDENRRKQ